MNDDIERMIRDLPWVKDGLSSREVEGVEVLIYLALYFDDVFFDLLQEPWVLEGNDRLSVNAMNAIAWLAYHERDTLDKLFDIGGDALRLLAPLAQANTELLDTVIAHPTIADGITDDEGKIFVVLSSAARYNPPLIDVLLDPDRVMLEERTVFLPLAGDVDLTMIRTKPGMERNMDLLEDAVLAIENFMSFPFPKSQVIWLFERAVRPGANGSNFGTHVVTVPEYYDVASTIKSPFRHFIHEASHYYWRGNSANWITEGAATFLETVIESRATGWPIAMERQPCPSARYIAEDVEGDCDYRFGERLFHDLYRNMDETAFRMAFRQLYLLSEYDDPNDGCDGTNLGICHVRAAFTADVSADTVAAVEKVIARWYDGSEPFDTSHQDTSAPDPVIAFMHSHIERAWVSDGPRPITAKAYPGNRLDFNIEYSCQHESLCTHILPLTIIQYFEGDGFNFNPRHYEGERLSFSLEGHVSHVERVSGDRYAQRFRLGSYASGGPEGRYWVYAYLGDQKIAEASYEIGRL
ncbi:MAG: hypothetical protein OXC99_02130 [Chloroflexi bacterium]|nr:hypothetical protein [Chloroflexota bacterium]